MKAIVLTRGRIATVDDSDFEHLSRFKWFAIKEKDGQIYYAGRNKRLPDGRRQTVQMHREILGITDSKVKVDHESGEGTDNRRSNLRVATDVLNVANSRKRRGCVSQFKGVHRDYRAKTNPWRAAVGGKNRAYLGVFSDKTAAARAYDKAAKKAFGKFARLNFA